MREASSSSQIRRRPAACEARSVVHTCRRTCLRGGVPASCERRKEEAYSWRRRISATVPSVARAGTAGPRVVVAAAAVVVAPAAVVPPPAVVAISASVVPAVVAVPASVVSKAIAGAAAIVSAITTAVVSAVVSAAVVTSDAAAAAAVVAAASATAAAATATTAVGPVGGRLGVEALVGFLVGEFDFDGGSPELGFVEERRRRVRGVAVFVLQQAIVVAVELDAVRHHVREHAAAARPLARHDADVSEVLHNLLRRHALRQPADVDPRVRARLTALARRPALQRRVTPERRLGARRTTHVRRHRRQG
mmetsp:Transcript_12970/g.39164  ORF Transcript_12970/g.39164 Transcript_12970/m.39164 type:complete len:307 (+) Transcript_12970:1035-1955(+)